MLTYHLRHIITHYLKFYFRIYYLGDMTPHLIFQIYCSQFEKF